MKERLLHGVNDYIRGVDTAKDIELWWWEGETWWLDTATRNTVQLKLTQLGLANRLTFILNTLDIKFKLNLMT